MTTRKPKVVKTFELVAEGAVMRNRQGPAWIVWWDSKGRVQWRRMSEAAWMRVALLDADTKG